MSIDQKLQQMLLETFRAELQETHQSLITALLSLEKTTDSATLAAKLKELFRYSHNIKGAAASASIPAISSIAHGLENLFQEWREKNYFPNREEINACLEVADNLLLALKLFDDGQTIDVENFLAPLRGEKTIREVAQTNINEFIKLPLTRIERANAKANEFIIYRLKLTEWFRELEFCLKEINHLPELNALPFIKKINNISSNGIQFLGDFSRAIQSLQEEIKAMRMIPISILLTPLFRTVRDLSIKLGKEVELVIYGGDIELDKVILDTISDPLQHVIRNAIDHGIESNQEREQKNKPIPATIRIEVTQCSGKILIKISDDGRGIDLFQIKKSALERGLCNEEEIENLSEEQILDFLFVSGFSLNKKVTEISGRGVGLDIVKANIEKIRGTIKIATAVNQGSCFTFILPLTLATMRGVFFRLKEQIFMLPTISLKALYEIKTDEIKLVNNQLSYVIDNKPIPLISLYYILNNQEQALNTKQDCFGLYIDYPGIDLILWLDAIVNEHDCVIKPLPPPFNQLTQYIGVTLTGDNHLVLVLEPNKIVEMALEQKIPATKFSAIQPTPAKIQKKVLVVDDSLTTRSLCANSLAAAGFEVLTATDGEQAWQLLQKEPFDCIITDIIMPKINGFELTKLIKGDNKLAHTPVIIISLLNSREYKEQGLAAGANAFVAKSEFDTHSLIEIMESLL
ncbi:hybrid sensor histidine kinase/response regulator [Legionella sp. D16C41]|uniref:hybrid sensor histidine kinase/response regulator n=1 Tax=Legionella sp. D16C41 TaxID=3402688 RepID=UPI003AF84903